MFAHGEGQALAKAWKGISLAPPGPSNRSSVGETRTGIGSSFFEDITMSGASNIYGGTRMGLLGNASTDKSQWESGGDSSAMVSSYIAFLEHEAEPAKRENRR
jgi:hypothetical protein